MEQKKVRGQFDVPVVILAIKIENKNPKKNWEALRSDKASCPHRNGISRLAVHAAWQCDGFVSLQLLLIGSCHYLYDREHAMNQSG